ncbi:MAG: FlgD immunoglobulin-like domain containing protein, partial [Bacteroidota bacterium]
QFIATASFIVADVNNDFDVNIADLTTMVDHILERRILAGVDSAKADVNRDGAINVLDIVVVQNALLGTVSLPKGIRPVASEISGGAEVSLAPVITGSLEITPLGTRLNLTNDVPIKGIQLVIALNTSATVNRTDVVFPRARDMQFFVNSSGGEVRLVVYNLQNVPIDTGSGSIVRLPLMLADTTEIDSVYAIISTADTAFDVAVRISLSAVQNAYPSAFRLYQNYPNPFNAGTNIQFEVPDVQGKFARTLVQVFNLLGEKVKTLARGEHTAGTYRVTWDGTDDHGTRVPTGVYFYRLVSGEYVSAKRMVMIK